MSEDPNARHLYSERVRIGRNIQSLRDWADQRQERLMENTASSDRTLRRVESGDTNVGINAYVVVAEALGVPLYWLFTEDWPRFAEERDARDGSGAGGGEPPVGLP